MSAALSDHKGTMGHGTNIAEAIVQTLLLLLLLLPPVPPLLPPPLLLLLLLQASKMEGFSIGSLTLPESGAKKTELCLELTSSATPGSPVFSSLANIRFTRVASASTQRQQPGSAAGASSVDSAALEALRAKCNWVGSANVAGDVDAVMESMFSPYDTEDTDSCVECQPQL
jgi:hypothetical protein